MTSVVPKISTPKLLKHREKSFEDLNNFKYKIKGGEEPLSGIYSYGGEYELRLEDVDIAYGLKVFDAPSCAYVVWPPRVSYMGVPIRNNKIATYLAAKQKFIDQSAVEVSPMGDVIPEVENAVSFEPELVSLNCGDEKFQEALGQLDICESQLKNEIQQAMQVAEVHSIKILSVDYDVYSDPEGGINCCVSLNFNGSLDDELLLEGELAEMLSANESWNPLKLNVEFKHHEIEDELRADRYI